MDEQTKILYQKISIYCGPIFVTTFVIFWAWLGHNLPPPHPDWPVQAFTDRYVNIWVPSASVSWWRWSRSVCICHGSGT